MAKFKRGDVVCLSSQVWINNKNVEKFIIEAQEELEGNIMYKTNPNGTILHENDIQIFDPKDFLPKPNKV